MVIFNKTQIINNDYQKAIILLDETISAMTISHLYSAHKVRSLLTLPMKTSDINNAKALYKQQCLPIV